MVQIGKTLSWSCNAKLHLTTGSVGVRNTEAQLKANTDDFSNYTGSKQAPLIWARKEDTGQSDSSQSLARLQITSTDLARPDCTRPTPLLSMMR